MTIYNLIRRCVTCSSFLCWSIAFALQVAVPAAWAGDLEFSDPAHVAPPPAGAIGFPNRALDFDVEPGFRNPPPGYGEVAFYWWLGDPLTKERLQWQLDQLAGKSVMGLQINYAHSDQGGQSYGLTYPSDPPLFSDAWWELVNWFMQQAKQRGMAVSLSDYTLGIGQGWSVDDVLREDPDLAGSVLRSQARDVDGGDVDWKLPAGTLMVAAYPIAAGEAVDLRSFVKDGRLRWQAPSGKHHLVVVYATTVRPSLDPMNPNAGRAYAAKFFGQFEEHNPNEAGQGLNFFFSDELGFGVGGRLWNARFADEFRRRKGYDLVPELPALFADIGPRTPKVRLDYSDVQVALTEEGFFQPVFDWHQKRGMIYGCDHGGRGRNVVEFGDYFRTQRWNQGPGCDQPHLGRDIIKNKVASSIAHLYQRPRVWLEGYYGSGWGTSSADVADATFANFVQGQNLLTLHGLYYSTHGGYWEWAPPCNHFRMPYWRHMGEFMQCAERLSFLLSQGYHQCDVAIMYPVAPTEAGVGGSESVEAAFAAGRHLYEQGIDFDFIDFESLARAEIVDRELHVSGERYRMLVLPAMRAVRWSTLEKAIQFQRAGGLVAVQGAAPEVSDRIGREDAELDSLVAELNMRVESPEQLAKAVGQAFPRDYRGPGHVMHRKLGQRDLYAIYNAPAGSVAEFRASGSVSLWDPWTGKTRPLPVLTQRKTRTSLRLPLDEKEVQLIVFEPNNELATATNEDFSDPITMVLDGEWEFELLPVLDNRFGDFRWPPTSALIGAEARQFRYADETETDLGWEQADFDDSQWPTVTRAFGPHFWRLGPLPSETELPLGPAPDPTRPVTLDGRTYAWSPYEFSWRWGIQDDPGHQGYHGLKEEVHDEFIGLGKLQLSGTGSRYQAEPTGSRYYLYTSVVAPKKGTYFASIGGLRPVSVWLNGQLLSRIDEPLALQAGGNALLLRYDATGSGYYVVSTQPAKTETDDAAFSPAACWIWRPNDRETATRFFRKSFQLSNVPEFARLRITCDNGYTVKLNGKEVGSGSRWEQIDQYDVAGFLQAGANEIIVQAVNQGDSAGLIAELTVGDVRVSTDATWQSAAVENGPSVAAEVISNFADSLWANHQLGPPQLQTIVTNVSQSPVLEVRTLASKWFENPSLLPFDTRPQVARPAGWYRFTSPPGLRALTLASLGSAKVWADGKPLEAAEGNRFVVAEPSPAPVKVAVRIQQRRGCYGGAAVPEPIALECGPGTIALGDWSSIDALKCYSGGAWYCKSVTLNAQQAASSVVLNLGDVVASAEVRINGHSAGICVAPPWKLDIAKWVQAGENRIEVLVYNTLANHYVTIPTRYRGSTKSGLLGPVRLEMSK